MNKVREESHGPEVQKSGSNDRKVGLCAVLKAHSSPVLPVDVMSFTALANREIPKPRSLNVGGNDREARSPTCQRGREKGSTEELPEKIQIIFTICLKYCLEHTYMKNYSSFAENSNLMGPPGFLLAVFGNCAPRPHGSQTLEGEEKATNPLCVCRVLGVFQTSIYCLLSGFYLMPERNRAGTFILINHAKETQAQAME